MEKKFKVGDKVRLKSGGPAMTVYEYKRGHDIVSAIYGRPTKPSWDTEIVHCQWFDDKSMIKGGDFHQDMLESIT